MLKIGDFSKLAQVSVKTLRYYAELGLLAPAWIDRFTGYRYYTPEQLPRLNRILALKDLGFSLEQVKDVLRKDLPAGELRGMLRFKHAELEQLLREEQARLSRVEARLHQIEQEGALPPYEVVIKAASRQRILGVRRTIPTYDGIFDMFQELCAYLRDRGLESGTTHPCLAIYYDREYRERDIDVEVAAPLAAPSPTAPGMGVRVLPAVRTLACTVHHGRLENLVHAYNALLTWIERNGYRVTGPNREVYLRGPEPPCTTSEVVAEVQFPIEPKPASLYLTYQEQERNKMQPMIVTKPAFTVVGFKYHGKNENQEIKGVWDVFNTRVDELLAAASGIGQAYGVCSSAIEPDGSFDYLAGLEVQAIAELPEGMEQWVVPEQTYAVFPCKLATIGEAYRYAFEEWLPQSGYRRADGPDFEYYDETFDVADAANSQLYVYVPITK